MRQDHTAGPGGRGQALVVVQGLFLGRKIDVPQAGLSIGPSDWCDIVVSSPETNLEQFQVRIDFLQGQMHVAALGGLAPLLVNHRPCREALLVAGDLLQVGATLFKVIGDHEEMRFHEMMYDMMVRDSLTGMFNRAHLGVLLVSEIDRARRLRLPLSVALLDIDNLKRINDTLGHAAGDAVLASVLGVLSPLMRESDRLCRYGGDEFLLVLPETGLAAAWVLAERCRLSLMGTRFPHGSRHMRVTVSVGVSNLASDCKRAEQLIQAADDALYLAKTRGRNRVCSPLSRPPPGPAFRLGTERFGDGPSCPTRRAGTERLHPVSAAFASQPDSQSAWWVRYTTSLVFRPQ